MRIGIVAAGAGGRRGGVEAYARGLLQALAAAGGHEAVHVDRDRLPGGRWLRARRALAAVTGWAPGADAASRAIDALGLDVVHYPATEIPESGLRTPAALTFFDMQEEYLPAFFRRRDRWARRFARRAAVRRARVVIVPSRFTGQGLRERYGVEPARIEHVPAGVGPEFGTEAAAGEGERLRGRYGLPAGGFLLYPANPWPHKNHERLLAALRALRDQGLSMPLVSTGRLQGERRSVAALAASAGLDGGAVRDLGFVESSDLPALYRAARALVFPSLFEGFGLPVVEAMASGLPVACARIAPLQEVGGEAVLGFDPHDTRDIERALRGVWMEEATRQRLRAQGLERAEQYRWPRLVPRLLEVYGRAAGGKA